MENRSGTRVELGCGELAGVTPINANRMESWLQGALPTGHARYCQSSTHFLLLLLLLFSTTASQTWALSPPVPTSQWGPCRSAQPASALTAAPANPAQHSRTPKCLTSYIIEPAFSCLSSSSSTNPASLCISVVHRVYISVVYRVCIRVDSSILGYLLCPYFQTPPTLPLPLYPFCL